MKRVIRKLTPELLKQIIAEEKLKLQKEQLRQKRIKIIKEKLKLSKEQLIELALIHKRQREAAAKFKRLHEQKEKIKKSIKR